MTNEIKVGDKVRVKKGFNCFKDDTMNFEVVRIPDTDNAIIRHVVAGLYGHTLTIPTKYLIKVEDEAKEPKYVNKDEYRNKSQYSPIDWNIEFGKAIERFKNELKDFSQFTEPIEEKSTTNHNGDKAPHETPKLTGLYDWYANGAPGVCGDPGRDPRRTKGRNTSSPNTAGVKVVMFDDFPGYWDKYTADLAKEVALKVANKFNDPEEAAEYAVSVAKAVAEGLKGK